MTESNTTVPRARGLDPDTGKRILLAVGLALQLLMMAAGLWPAAWLVLRFAPVSNTPGHWVLLILGAVLVFNYGYLLALLLLRIVFLPPDEGLHAFERGGKMPLAIRRFMIGVLLLKARRDPPWAAMFSAVLTRVPPLAGLFTHFFGPRTSSITLGDTVNILDPRLVEAGKNVEFGFDCTIIAHHFDNRGLYIRRVTIGDHAVIGGESLLMAGVEVGHHAVIGSRAMVLPDTKIGPYEFWAGAPARKIKNLAPDESPRFTTDPHQSVTQDALDRFPTPAAIEPAPKHDTA